MRRRPSQGGSVRSWEVQSCHAKIQRPATQLTVSTPPPCIWGSKRARTARADSQISAPPQLLSVGSVSHSPSPSQSSPNGTARQFGRLPAWLGQLPRNAVGPFRMSWLTPHRPRPDTSYDQSMQFEIKKMQFRETGPQPYAYWKPTKMHPGQRGGTPGWDTGPGHVERR